MVILIHSMNTHNIDECANECFCLQLTSDGVKVAV